MNTPKTYDPAKGKAASEAFVIARRAYRGANDKVTAARAQLEVVLLEKKHLQLTRAQTWMEFTQQQLAAKQSGQKLVYPTLSATGDK